MDEQLLIALVYLLAAVAAVPIAKRLGLGAVLGYLLAGIVIGPWGLGLITEVKHILEFSEFGVVLLLFNRTSAEELIVTGNVNERDIYGNMAEDFASALFMYPNVVSQMHYQSEEKRPDADVFVKGEGAPDARLSGGSLWARPGVGGCVAASDAHGAGPLLTGACPAMIPVDSASNHARFAHGKCWPRIARSPSFR